MENSRVGIFSATSTQFTDNFHIHPKTDMFEQTILFVPLAQLRAYHGSEFLVANTLAKWKKLEPNEINFSQGFSQKVVSTIYFAFISLSARGVFYCLLS